MDYPDCSLPVEFHLSMSYYQLITPVFFQTLHDFKAFTYPYFSLFMTFVLHDFTYCLLSKGISAKALLTYAWFLTYLQLKFLRETLSISANLHFPWKTAPSCQATLRPAIVWMPMAHCGQISCGLRGRMKRWEHGYLGERHHPGSLPWQGTAGRAGIHWSGFTQYNNRAVLLQHSLERIGYLRTSWWRPLM